MNRQQASVFIHALNMIQPHVSPLLFDNLAGTDVVRVLTAIANNQVACDIKLGRQYGIRTRRRIKA